MRLVFEHHKPVFLSAVYPGLDFDAACIYFLRLIQIVCLAVFLEIFRSDTCHVHQTQILISVAVNILSHIQILGKGMGNQASVRTVLKPHLFECSVECGMSAVIRPVCVDDLELCQRRIPVFILHVICLYSLYISRAHRKAHILSVLLESFRAEFPESVYNSHVLRSCRLHFQILRLFL